MNNLIPISYDNPERPTVSGRELHEFLQVGTKYADWFKRMCEYGFTKHEDFEVCFSNLGSEKIWEAKISTVVRTKLTTNSPSRWPKSCA